MARQISKKGGVGSGNWKLPGFKCSVWDVQERRQDGESEWYFVFARSKSEALAVVVNHHYKDLSIREYVREYRPTVGRLPDRQKLVCNVEGEGQLTKTVRSWAKGEKPGPFMSSTYDG